VATSPAYAATVDNGANLVGTLESNLQVPVHAALIFTAGANGSKIEEIVVQASNTALTVTTVAGLVYLFLYDGTTYHLFDTIAVTAISGTATVAPFRLSKVYNNLVLKSGWYLYASQSIAGNNSLLKVHALGGDY
jgi:hypothetical protein